MARSLAPKMIQSSRTAPLRTMNFPTKVVGASRVSAMGVSGDGEVRPMLAILVSSAMIAALLLVAAIARAAEPVNNPDTFTVAEIQDVSSLDPVFPYDGASQSIIQNVYETLIGFKGSSLTEFEPRIAEKVPSLENGGISPDGR